jgi:cysteine-rich repeat protein
MVPLRKCPLLAMSTTLLLAGSCRFGLDNPNVGDGGLEIPPGCGDGVVGGNEECDDGNFSNTDGCLENCRRATCGDGFVRAEVEACDDGNSDNDDGCTRFCGLCPTSADAHYVSETTEHCYTKNSIPNAFDQADDQCKEQGGRLVSYATAEEFAEVSMQLPLDGPTWIGLEQVSSGWRWVDGAPETFSNWAAGFPLDHPFAKQLVNGEWESTTSEVLPFLCEIDKGTRWRVRPEDGHAYTRFRTAVPWEVAQAECERLGAHLAVITSAAEEVFIREEIGVGVNPLFDGWIGLSDVDQDGVFTWVDGEPLGFSAWGPEQPNQDGYCVIHEAAWNDRACAALNTYYCEIDD